MTGVEASAPAPRPIALGIAVVVASFVIDQLAKTWVLFGSALPDGEIVRVTPFMDLTLVWNRGISYGLFQQDTAFGRWTLVVFSILAVVVLSVWLARTNRRLVAASIALIIGGALSNLVDRIVYGAVVDYVYLHAFGYSWYVFNLADAWIVAGVIGLLYDSLRSDARA